MKHLICLEMPAGTLWLESFHAGSGRPEYELNSLIEMAAEFDRTDAKIVAKALEDDEFISVFPSVTILEPRACLPDSIKTMGFKEGELV